MNEGGLLREDNNVSRKSSRVKFAFFPARVRKGRVVTFYAHIWTKTTKFKNEIVFLFLREAHTEWPEWNDLCNKDFPKSRRIK